MYCPVELESNISTNKRKRFAQENPSWADFASQPHPLRVKRSKCSNSNIDATKVDLNLQQRVGALPMEYDRRMFPHIFEESRISDKTSLSVVSSQTTDTISQTSKFKFSNFST